MRKRGFYERVVKRILDVTLALLTFLFFGWAYIVLAILVRTKLGSPVIFKQPRPGMKDKNGREKVFYMYKFRTMTDERDDEGNLLPDEIRLTSFGKKLRATSLDELPEMVNILKGDMSIIGPRPQLVRDMVFMSDEVRMRHTARPGLSGLAQVMGRNAISWDEKFKYDLEYINHVTFGKDVWIVGRTIRKVFIRSDITESSDEIDVTDDYGDYLLKSGRISKEEYDLKQQEARNYR